MPAVLVGCWHRQSRSPTLDRWRWLRGLAEGGAKWERKEARECARMSAVS